MCALLVRQLVYRKSTRIAFYLPNDGEISLQIALQHSLTQNKSCYLPVIRSTTSSRMRFALFDHRTHLKKNRFGIFEPSIVRRKYIFATALDLVLMPLVAFDSTGHRLGMGGGYYDETFAFLKHRRFWKRPKLIGIAYDFQQLNNLPDEVWDVPLDGVITNNAFMKIKSCKLLKDKKLKKS